MAAAAERKRWNFADIINKLAMVRPTTPSQTTVPTNAIVSSEGGICDKSSTARTLPDGFAGKALSSGSTSSDSAPNPC